MVSNDIFFADTKRWTAPSCEAFANFGKLLVSQPKTGPEKLLGSSFLAGHRRAYGFGLGLCEDGLLPMRSVRAARAGGLNLESVEFIYLELPPSKAEMSLGPLPLPLRSTE